MQAPPSRYRVVEKGGRLVVLDRGEPVKTLVSHSHPVVTPGARRKTERPPLAGKARKATASPPAVKSPGGMIGDGRSNGMKVLGKFALTIVGLTLFLAFFWPFLIPLGVVVWIALGFFGSKEDPAWRRIFRAWLRWLNAA